MGKDRVERIWRREGLKVPRNQKPRGRLWLNDGSCVRLRPERRNHVWAYDFVSGFTHDGRTVRFLNLIDEYTRECLAIHVGRRINSNQVIDVLAEAMIEHGVPDYIRSDNGPEFVARQLQQVGQLLHGLEPLPPELIDPVLQMAHHGSLVVIAPQPVEAFFEQVGLHDAPVQCKQFVELLLFARGQMYPARQQQPTLSLDQFPCRSALAEELGPANLVDRCIGVLHDVELVIEDAAVGQPLLDALAERFPHIHAGSLYCAALKGAQLLGEELVKRFLLPLGAEPERLGGLEIAHHRDELLLLAQKALVHAHLPQGRLAPRL